MSEAWQVGDLVQLKSGGPVMTITGVLNYSGEYYCSWFAGKKAESKAFPPGALQKAKESDD